MIICNTNDIPYFTWNLFHLSFTWDCLPSTFRPYPEPTRFAFTIRLNLILKQVSFISNTHIFEVVVLESVDAWTWHCVGVRVDGYLDLDCASKYLRVLRNFSRWIFGFSLDISHWVFKETGAAVNQHRELDETLRRPWKFSDKEDWTSVWFFLHLIFIFICIHLITFK